MSATATELFEQISALTEILNIRQSRDRSQCSGTGSEGSLAPSVQSLRKALQFTRQLHNLPVRTSVRPAEHEVLEP